MVVVEVMAGMAFVDLLIPTVIGATLGGQISFVDDWKVHRPICNSIHAGTWKEITVQRPSTFNLNRYDVVGHPEIYARSLEFMKNIQLAAADTSTLPAAIGQRVDPRERDGQSMLIYDRQASMEVALQRRHADAEEFEAVAMLVKAKSFRGLRIFFWVRRIGDWNLEVCMGHLPEEQKW
ncbi:hypothetical protein B0H19DRAFT_1069670 [Mycena capillaripes]|nr:hypothetical protein B0H19DRAFT_1069670 [Mycena capillaripes]